VPACRPRRGRGRAGYARRGTRRDDGTAARRAARAPSNDSSTLTARCGSPALPNNCTAPDRFPVESLRCCNSHGLTARVRLELVGLQQENVVDPTSPRRAISPVASPEYTPASLEYTPTLDGPQESLIRRTKAAHTGALPYYNSSGGDSNSIALVASSDFVDPTPASPPPPMAPWASGRKTATVAANRRSGLRSNSIRTGHIPVGNSTGDSGRRPSPSGEEKV
jgi:hypothetical protein